MKSKLTKSELLLKIAELTNQVEGLTKEEKYEIKIFQRAFMDKFIDDNDPLKGDVEKMISINELEEVKKLFPNSVNKINENRTIEIAKVMKEMGDDPMDITKRTGLSLDEIEEL